MKIRIIHTIIFISLIFTSRPVFSQQIIILSGVVTDSITGTSLPGAAILEEITGKGTVSDSLGHFSINLKKGNNRLTFSYLGYKTKHITLNLQNSNAINVALSPSFIETEEVVITADNPLNKLQNVKTGNIRLSKKELLQVPALLGEADPLMTLHYTPGVQSAGEGNSGFYVRGGNIDQNLILLDNATVFNPSHVLGFFSVFNTDIINSAELIKSGMPVRYGGRLSSVLIISTKDGNYEKMSFGLNAGLISSKFTLEGPLIKNKMSFIASFRRTYVDEVLKPLIRPFTGGSSSFYNYSKYHFFDFNGKLSWILNKKNRINVIFYTGTDDYKLEKLRLDYDNKINWGNGLFSINWNHSFNFNTFLNSSFSYSDYTFSFNANQNQVSIALFSAIKKGNYKLEFGKADFRIGFDGHFNYFVPNELLLDINQTDLNYSSNQRLYATEASLYSSYEFDLGNKFRIYTGLRYTNYLHLGPYTLYKETAPNVFGDTLTYDDFRVVKPYNSFEPRIACRFLVSGTSSIKASYTRNYQYIHIASASSVALPSDIWIPSTSQVKPQYADHFSLGYYRNLFGNKITASVDAYYKNLYNQIELLYGIGIGFQEKSFEKSIVSGNGKSYGIELFVEKTEGKTTGWLGYTLAKTTRKFDEINEGKIYPAKYDRRHDLNIVVIRQLNPKWSFSMAFIFATGNAMTLPYQKYIIDSRLLNLYGNTNSFRMPAYHRLDLAANYHFNLAKQYESTLNFSVFNAYNRANPFYIYFELDNDVFRNKLDVKAKQISLFPIVPSISLNIKF